MNQTIVATAVLLSSLWISTSVKAENPDHLKQLRETQQCRKCDLSGADLRGIKLAKADLSGANLSGANLSEVVLEGANLRGANLQKAVLVKVNLRFTNLEGANLSGANLSEADLRNANLTRIELKDAILTGALGLTIGNSSSTNPEASSKPNTPELPPPVRSTHYNPPEGVPAPSNPASGGSR